MAIAHQTEVFTAEATSAGTQNTTVNPGAGVAPKGVCVIIHVGSSIVDAITSVSYGGVPLARAASPYGFATESTEAGGIYIYWAGDSVVFGSGAQTVAIAFTQPGTSTMRAMISTMTCAAGQIVTLAANNPGATGQSASVANPSWTHTTTDTVVAYLGIHSGLTTMTTTPATNWVLQGSQDAGAIGRGFARRPSSGTATGALAPGWTAATADDFVGCSIAFMEAAPPAAPSGRPPARRQPRRGRGKFSRAIFA